MALPNLDCLPVETFAEILDSLEVADILRLRMTSSAIRYLATQDKFKDLCRRKQILLTESSLQKFVDIVNISQLARSLLHSLRLLHPDDADAHTWPPPCDHNRKIREKLVRDGKLSSVERQPNAEEQRRHEVKPETTPPQAPEVFARFPDMLCDAFKSLMASCPGFQLGCLQLRVQNTRPQRHGRTGAPLAVAKTFTVAMRALKASRLPVRQLDLFRQRAFFLGWDAFEGVHDSLEGGLGDGDGEGDLTALHASLVQLRRLSLNLTMPPKLCKIEKANPKDDIYILELQRLVQLPHDLRSLDITYDDRSGISVEPSPTAKLLHELTVQRALTSLRELRLSFLTIAAGDLHDILEGCRDTLSHLSLCYVWLDSIDSMERLFQLCVNRSTTPHLERFEFSHLSEWRRTEVSGVSRMRCMAFIGELPHCELAWNDGTGSSTEGFNRRASTAIKRSGEDLRRPIVYFQWDAFRRAPVGPQLSM